MIWVDGSDPSVREWRSARWAPVPDQKFGNQPNEAGVSGGMQVAAPNECSVRHGATGVNVKRTRCCSRAPRSLSSSFYS